MKPSTSRFLDVRGLRYHLREWGTPGSPKVFLLHGWMDASASFQFLVDAVERDWHVLAPDWRGFGDSEWNEEPAHAFVYRRAPRALDMIPPRGVGDHTRMRYRQRGPSWLVAGMRSK